MGTLVTAIFGCNDAVSRLLLSRLGSASAAFGLLLRLDSDGHLLSFRTRAAVRGLLRLLLAVRGLLANESALGFRAVGRTVALPIAHWLLAN